MIDNDKLLGDLQEGVRTSTNNRACTACEALDLVSGTSHDALMAALGGTIGQGRLAKILKRNGLAVSERQISKHRREGHTS